MGGASVFSQKQAIRCPAGAGAGAGGEVRVRGLRKRVKAFSKIKYEKRKWGAPGGRVPLRGVKAEARFPCAESEQGGMTSCHS